MGIKSTLRDVLWRVQPQWMHRRMLKGGAFHSEIEEHVVEAILDPGATVLDVGANIGRYTAVFHAACKRVVAFEPNPAVAGLLERVGYANVEVVRKALSSSPETKVLNVPLVDGAETSTLGTLETGVLDQPHTTHQIETTMLDAYADDPVGFVKIDVEGHEFDVVQGAARLMVKAKPDFLIEAEDRHRPGTIEDLMGYFAGHGYRCFFIYRGRTHAGDAFRADMQDEAALASDQVPRRFRNYMNNFFFVAGPEREAEVRGIIDARLLGMRAEAPDWFEE